MWKDPLFKFERAVDCIAAAHESTYMAVRSYKMAHIEVSAMNRVLHMATNSLRLASLHHLREVSGLPASPIGPYLDGTPYRSAHATLHNIESLFGGLREAAMLLPSWNLGRARYSPLGWDSPAFCEIFVPCSLTVPCLAVPLISCKLLLANDSGIPN